MKICEIISDISVFIKRKVHEDFNYNQISDNYFNFSLSDIPDLKPSKNR